jgi:hypothetical protein
MLRSRDRAILDAQVRLEGTAKELEQNLEADLCDGWVITALAELVADEGVLGPGEFVEASGNAGGTELGADKITAGVRDVGVLDAENHGNFSVAEVGEAVESVLAVRRGRVGRSVGRGVGAESARVNICGEV